MKKAVEHITKGLPVLALLFITILFLMIPDHTFSKSEMRYLVQAPRIEWADVLNGSYGEAWEVYFSDQFPFRDFWLMIYRFSERVLNTDTVV